MLVLSRKLGEKIFIGENICITVVDIDRGKIRLGIEAPRDVPIYRQELLPLKNAEAPVPGALDGRALNGFGFELAPKFIRPLINAFDAADTRGGGLDRSS